MECAPWGTLNPAVDTRLDVTITKQTSETEQGVLVNTTELVFYKLCFSCCVTLALLLLIELTSTAILRIKGSPHGDKPLPNESSVYKSTKWGEQFWKENYEAGRFVYEPYVVWKQLPYTGSTLNIDSNLQRRTVGSECSDASYTIWMFGGSTMWGAGSPDWGTIPSQLAGILSRAGKSSCVENFAQTGWRNTQELIELELQLKRAAKKPNLVVFYDGYNDGYSFYQSGQLDTHLNYDRIREEMERPSRPRRLGFVADFLLSTHTARLITGAQSPRSLIEGFAVPLPPIPTVEGAKRDLQISYLDNLDIVDALSKEYGFQYAWFWQPVIFAGHKPLTQEEQKIFTAYSKGIYETDLEYKAMEQVFRAGGRPHLFDISDTFDHCTQTVYVDYVHVSPQGNQLVAQRMFALLQEKGWLPISETRERRPTEQTTSALASESSQSN